MGTIKRKVTAEFGTSRNVTARAEYSAQTKRGLRELVALYKSHPRLFWYHALIAFVIGLVMTGLSFILNTHISDFLIIILPNILGIFLSIALAWICQPKLVVGPEWYEWQKSAKS
jgi:hypothetical protein